MTQVDSRVGTLDLDGEKVIRVEGDNEGRVEIVADLAGYLAKLGLADGELDQMITMLQNERREEVPEETTSGGPVGVQRSADRPNGTIGLFLAEEQQILREAYQSVFCAQTNMNMLGVTADLSTDFLAGMVQALQPDVIILGVKAVQPCTVEKLEVLRDTCPQWDWSCCWLCMTGKASRLCGNSPGILRPGAPIY